MQTRIQLARLLGGWGVAALLVPAFAAAQQAPPLPSAGEIVDKVIERAQKTEKQKQSYAFRRQSVTEKLHDDGSVKEREVKIFEAVWVDGARYARLVEKDGRPLTEEELKDERKREREFREDLAEQRRNKDKEKDRGDFRFDEELVSKYRGEVLGRERVNGRLAYILRFEPKSDDLPARRRLDRLLNRVAGKLWIDAEDYEIAKAEGSLLEPVKWGWGILASFHTLDFEVEQVRLDNGVWMPRRFDAYVRGRVVFSTTHERLSSTWTGYHQPPEQAGDASGSP